MSDIVPVFRPVNFQKPPHSAVVLSVMLEQIQVFFSHFTYFMPDSTTSPSKVLFMVNIILNH